MGYRPPILDALETPVSTAVIVLLILVFYLLHRWGSTYVDVGSSWPLILDSREYWRMISATVAHFDLIHIVANISSAWTCRPLEYFDGSVAMLKYIVVLAVTSELLDCAIRKYFVRGPLVVSVGYSGVVCGLYAILAARSSSVNLFGVEIPWSVMPFIQIVLTSLLVPAASFIGHLAGTVVGFLISWHVFDWLTNALFLNLLPWVAGLFFLNFVAFHRERFSWVAVSRARLGDL